MTTTRICDSAEVLLMKVYVSEASLLTNHHMMSSVAHLGLPGMAQNKPLKDFKSMNKIFTVSDEVVLLQRSCLYCNTSNTSP